MKKEVQATLSVSLPIVLKVFAALYTRPYSRYRDNWRSGERHRAPEDSSTTIEDNESIRFPPRGQIFRNAKHLLRILNFQQKYQISQRYDLLAINLIDIIDINRFIDYYKFAKFRQNFVNSQFANSCCYEI